MHLAAVMLLNMFSMPLVGLFLFYTHDLQVWCFNGVPEVLLVQFLLSLFFPFLYLNILILYDFIHLTIIRVHYCEIADFRRS
jgi:hypothetical protein